MHFMKAYPKQNTGYAVVGGSNGGIAPKTYWKHLWPFVYAIAELEPCFVSNLSFFIHISLYQNSYTFPFYIRSVLLLITGGIILLGQGQTAIAFWASTELIVASLTPDRRLHHTNTKWSLHSDVRLELTCWRDTLLGSMGDFPLDIGQTLRSLSMGWDLGWIQMNALKETAGTSEKHEWRWSGWQVHRISWIGLQSSLSYQCTKKQSTKGLSSGMSWQKCTAMTCKLTALSFVQLQF